ncbi:MAG: carbon-nitrogen hydrolase family protein [Oscillospiraceae bacterium]|nr:carbon-nitrogen hydrolase family protein [Oscillospiraceae bacterium]
MNSKNLLENVESQSKWTSWSPRKELSPEFFISNNKLTISANNNPTEYVYGKFLSGEIPVSDSHIIIFEALFSCQNVKNEENSIFAMLSFYDNQKVMLERDYVDIIYDIDGKVKKLYRKLDVPENAAYVIIEIGARWCPQAVVEWDNIRLETENKSDMPSRIVKIATTYKERRDTREENLSDMIEIINKVGKSNPDVILLSELVYESCHNETDSKENGQPVPGPLTDTIGEYAKKYNTYIIFSMNEKESGIIYNTAVIIGRDGKVCGKYRKIHLPLNEAEAGTSPGNTHGIFDLDFGRIGIIICYDQMFPENSRTLALMGAEIIFIPTMGEEEILQRAIARSNGVHVVVSGYVGSASSRIINPLGEIVNFVKDKDTAYAAEQIDLTKRFFVYWMSIGAGNGETKVLFRKERMTDSYGNINKESHKIEK